MYSYSMTRAVAVVIRASTMLYLSCGRTNSRRFRYGTAYRFGVNISIAPISNFGSLRTVCSLIGELVMQSLVKLHRRAQRPHLKYK